MYLHTLSDGRLAAGTTTYTMTEGRFGGALISTDGTNAAVVTVTCAGKKIFDISTKIPGFAIAPIQAGSNDISCEVSGVGAAAQFYEWVTER